MTRELTTVMTASVTVGVDLGGTGTRIVALDGDGTIVQSTVFPTVSAVSDQAVGALVTGIVGVTQGMQVTAIGIGASGPVDDRGVIQNPATLPAYTGLSLCTIVTERLGCPCVIDNDAAAAALGEYVYGAGRGSRATVTVTLGTGIGAAVIIDGTLVRAADGTHPEAGHVAVLYAPTECYCGLRRCWEQAASRTALEGLTGGDPRVAANSARAGDARAATAFDRYGERVASGLGTLLTLFRPDRVVLGGSAARYLDLFVDSMTAALQRSSDYQWLAPIVPAELGDLAGAVGAAVLARPRSDIEPPLPLT